MVAFSLGDPVEAIRASFSDRGYVVFERAIPEAPIDAFLDAYERVKRHPRFVYFAQSIHLAVRPRLSEHGFMVESMQNGTRLAFFREFTERFKDCIYHPRAADALTAVDGHVAHVSWQNMFFDRSTGTIEHQDSWYLDTDPPGALLGVWYALEDIQAPSGAFFVCPGSHRASLVDRKDVPDHDAFVHRVRELVDQGAFSKEPMLLRKGDLLLWHPFLVHGAFSPTDPAYSRRSFTSHFYPRGARAKDTEREKLLSIYDHAHPRPTRESRLFTAYRFNDHFYNLLLYPMYALARLASLEARTSMRREDHD